VCLARPRSARLVSLTPQISNEIVGYRIGRDGQLTEVARVLSPSERVEGAVVSPDGRLLYAGTFGFQPETPDFPPDPTRPSALLAFRIGTGGELTLVATIPTPDPIGIAFGPDGRRLYVSSYTANEITTFAVQPTGGLTPLQDAALRWTTPGVPVGQRAVQLILFEPFTAHRRFPTDLPTARCGTTRKARSRRLYGQVDHHGACPPVPERLA
jgi:hypothetical protein